MSNSDPIKVCAKALEVLRPAERARKTCGRLAKFSQQAITYQNKHQISEQRSPQMELFKLKLQSYQRLLNLKEQIRLQKVIEYI